MATFEIETAEQMRELGQRIAAQLIAGDIVVLTGPLGAGKTTFVQGIGSGLGVTGDVTSPTFVVARQHRAGTQEIGLLHIDAYRLQTSEDLIDLDIDDTNPHVTVIEWGEPFIDQVSDSWLSVIISRDTTSDDDSPENGVRLVQVTTHGPAWRDRAIKVET